MNAIQEAVHIFAKDVRCLWKEIAGFVAMCAAAGVIVVREPVDLHGFGGWSAVLLLVGMALLTSRAVQNEAIPGERQYWLTRPMGRGSLLTARLLFLITCVHLPVALMQAGIVIWSGFAPGEFLPGLLGSQVLLAVFITLPSLAIAALTTGMPGFTAHAFVIVALTLMIGPYLPGGDLWSVDWVRYSLFAVVILVSVCLVVVGQYWLRSTVRSRLLAGVSLLVLAFCGPAVPWNRAWAVQQAVGGVPSSPVTAISSTGTVVDVVWESSMVEVTLKAEVAQGEGTDLQADRVHARLVNAVGGDLYTTLDARRMCLSGAKTCMFLSTVRIPRPMWKAPGLKYEIEIFLTAYGSARAELLPESLEHRTWVSGDLSCFEGARGALSCRSPFRWPRDLITLRRVGESTELSFGPVPSHSPFPATLGILPLLMRWQSLYPATPSGIRPRAPYERLELLRRASLWHTSVRFSGTVVAGDPPRPY